MIPGSPSPEALSGLLTLDSSATVLQSAVDCGRMQEVISWGSGLGSQRLRRGT